MADFAVVHHYQLPKRGRLTTAVPGGTKIVGAQWRHDGGPSVYVEKPFEGVRGENGDVFHITGFRGQGGQTLEAFFIATGEEFELDGFAFVQTVTPDGHYFFHVYARIT